MAEAEKTNPFAIIQIMLGTDLIPTMAEAEEPMSLTKFEGEGGGTSV